MADDDPRALARTIDPKADYPLGLGADDGCLLIFNEHADAVMALFPGSWRDDNDPPTAWTRIVYPTSTEEA
jgi:hypothetical protein